MFCLMDIFFSFGLKKKISLSNSSEKYGLQEELSTWNNLSWKSSNKSNVDTEVVSTNISRKKNKQR